MTFTICILAGSLKPNNMKHLITVLFLTAFFVGLKAQNGHLTAHYVKLHHLGNTVQMLNPTDAHTIWGMAYTLNGDTVVTHQAIDMEAVRSCDGGRTWKSLPIPGTSLSDSSYLSNFWPIDSNTAYVALFNIATGHGGRILKTSDGGNTWLPLTLPGGAFASGFLDFLYFSSTDTGLAVGDPNGGAFEIYTTANAGQTWVPTTNSNIPPSVPGESGWSYDFTFTSDTFYFVSTIGGSRRLYQTGDHGQTWTATSPTTDAIIELNTLINDGHISVFGSPYAPNKTYGYSGNFSASSSYAPDPDSAGGNVTFGSIFRTRADNTYIMEKVYHPSDTSFAVDSFTLYMCNGADTPFHWVPVLTSNKTCNLNNAFVNFFYDQSDGWLMGDAFSDTMQVIFHYQNCAVNTPPSINVYDLAVGDICKGSDTINLNHYGYASPPGGTYTINRTVDSLITPSLVTNDPFYPFLFLYYDYVDASGCEAQASSYAYLDTTHTAPALSQPSPLSVCSNASPLLLDAVTPSGGYYYGNSVANDTFYPAQAVMGTNYAIYQYVDTATQCANKAEIKVIVENCTGIASLDAQTSVSVYPNPTSGILTIESASQIQYVQILNVLGSVVMEKQNANGGTAPELDIESLPAGTYLITVGTQTGRTIRPIIKM
jgi:photosystem II stability/assembly factor-like uncharacterized protein